jgi:hypothetical protein
MKRSSEYYDDAQCSDSELIAIAPLSLRNNFSMTDGAIAKLTQLTFLDIELTRITDLGVSGLFLSRRYF